MGKVCWSFNEPKNLAVFTTKHVVSDGKPVLYVSHDLDDGAWQFLSDDDFNMEDAMIVSLEEVFKIDNSISDIADLPLGWKAWRQSTGCSWQRYKNE